MKNFDEKIKFFEKKIKSVETKKVGLNEKPNDPNISEKSFLNNVEVNKFFNKKVLIKSLLFLSIFGFITIMVISYRIGVVEENELVGTDIIKAEVLKIIPSDKGGIKIESLDKDVYEAITESSVNVKPTEKKIIDLEKDKQKYLKDFVKKDIRNIKNSKRLVATNVDESIKKDDFIIDDFTNIDKNDNVNKNNPKKEAPSKKTKPVVNKNVKPKIVKNTQITKDINKPKKNITKKIVNKYQKLNLNGWFINIGSYKTLDMAVKKYKSFVGFHEYLSENKFSIEKVDTKYSVLIFSFNDRQDVVETCDYIKEFNNICFGDKR